MSENVEKAPKAEEVKQKPSQEESPAKAAEQKPQEKRDEAPKAEEVKQEKPPLRFGPILHTPLISVIAVNYNGERDLPAFLLSLSKQSYRNFELIVVDNASTDRSAQVLKEYEYLFERVVFVRNDRNVGFAAGNNTALKYCRGEFLALINVDTVVDEEWLKELLDALSDDPAAAAATSKTLFFERFADLTLVFDEEFELDIERLVSSLDYRKYFVRRGKKDEDRIKSEDGRIVISLPLQNREIDILLHRKGIESRFITLARGNLPRKKFHFGRESLELSVDFSLESLKSGRWIINNAGSVTMDGMPGDRGLGQYDRGQFDAKGAVDFFCGVSVLLRRSAIVEREIFVPEFFAYYEDSELSRWIRQKRMRIVYNPRSVVRHRHSATSSEGSPLWNLLVTRSREIYRYDGSKPQKLIGAIKHLEWYFSPRVDSGVIERLGEFSDSLERRIKGGGSIVPHRESIAIFNRYWNTKGGGESHALSIAEILQKRATVYLLSDSDFSIEELERYYHIDLGNCRKLVESRMSDALTEKFDIFINSTFLSNLSSRAAKSYYIVSFPHKNISKEALASYTFLYNSDYTAQWARRYWGKEHRERILYPIGMIDTKRPDMGREVKKEKIILSVGRFFRYGHSKNQLIIARAFRRFLQRGGGDGEWKLVLIGSLNEDVEDDMRYFSEVRKELEGSNHEIIENADRSVLKEYYEKAYIYLHASGFGRDPQKDPDKFEHFGITPVEAMARGCYPVVYRIGGPASLLSKLGIGRVFGSIAELVDILQELTEAYPKALHGEVLERIHDFLESNALPEKLEEIIAQGEII